MRQPPRDAPAVELTDEALAAVYGGLSIIQNPDERVPDGVTFTPKPSKPERPVIIQLPPPYRPFPLPTPSE